MNRQQKDSEACESVWRTVCQIRHCWHMLRGFLSRSNTVTIHQLLFNGSSAAQYQNPKGLQGPSDLIAVW